MWIVWLGLYHLERREMNLEADLIIISYGGGYQEYWTHDENWDNVIPKNWGEFPEGFNVIDFLR